MIAGALGGICAGILDVLAAWGRLDLFLPDFLDRILLTSRVGAIYGVFGAFFASTMAGLFWLLVRFTHLGTLLFPDTSFGWCHQRGVGGGNARLAIMITWLVSALVLFRQVLSFAASTLAEHHNPTLMLAVIICTTLGSFLATIPISLAIARPLGWLFQALPEHLHRAWMRRISGPIVAPFICMTVLLSWLAFEGWSRGGLVRGVVPVILGIGWLTGSFAWILSWPIWRRALDLHLRLRRSEDRGGPELAAVAIALVLGISTAVLLNVVLGRILLHRTSDPQLGAPVLLGLTFILIWCVVPASTAIAFAIQALLPRILPISWQPSLSRPNSPYVAAALVMGMAAVAVTVISRRVAPLLHLRAEGAVGVWLAASILWRGPAERLGTKLRHCRPWIRWGVVGIVASGLGTWGLSTFANSAETKAANAWTGLTRPLLATIRYLTDRDGDGYSPILGGGDCNDSDPSIHPLALDVPEDGIDQNCSGADAPRLPQGIEVAPDRPAGVPIGLNVLIITIDCIRAGHVGAYGYQRPTTPFLDELARESVVFDHAYSNASFTVPSITAIMTGRYVSQARWASRPEQRVLAEDNGTIGAVMKSTGADTGAIVWSPGPLNPSLGFHHGFDDFIAPTGPPEAIVASQSAARDLFIVPGKTSFAEEQADLAIRWMRNRAGHRFFLWVHFIDPHPPYNHHKGTLDFGADGDAMSDHELRFTDGQVGRIHDWLKQSGLASQTAIFVTSDHGSYYGEQMLPPQSFSLYPDLTRVPLIIRIPQLAGRRVAAPVSHVDLLPTVAQLAGVGIPIALPGHSLLRLMTGGAAVRPERPIYQMVAIRDEQRRAVVDGCDLLIHNILPESTYERYDLCRQERGRLQDVYDSIRDRGLRELLSKLEDANQVPLPAWNP